MIDFKQLYRAQRHGGWTFLLDVKLTPSCFGKDTDDELNSKGVSRAVSHFKV